MSHTSRNEAVNGASGRPPHALLRGCSVLVVDDEETYRSLLTIILEQAGCRVDVSVDGCEAVQSVEKHSYDLILMDCQMPRMDGFEAARRIRLHQGAQPRTTPILAVTANAAAVDPQRYAAAGMTDILGKPFAPEELIQRCTRLLRAPHSGNGPIQAPVLQLATSFEKVRPAIVRQIVGMFVDEGPLMLNRLLSAVQSGDLTEAAKAAHRMRGGAVRGMMPRLESTLADLENACRNQQQPQELPLASLQEAFESAHTAARAFIASDPLQ